MDRTIHFKPSTLKEKLWYYAALAKGRISRAGKSGLTLSDHAIRTKI